MEPQYSFMLTSGRRVWLEAFHFEKTYAGLMAGYPKNQPGYITSQEKKAEVMWVPGAIFTIPPMTILREHSGRRFESWPLYCYKAWLTSEAIDPNDAGSQLIVIWFAEHSVGISLTAMVEKACRDVPWEPHAKGWNF